MQGIVSNIANSLGALDPSNKSVMNEMLEGAFEKKRGFVKDKIDAKINDLQKYYAAVNEISKKSSEFKSYINNISFNTSLDKPYFISNIKQGTNKKLDFFVYSFLDNKDNNQSIGDFTIDIDMQMKKNEFSMSIGDDSIIFNKDQDINLTIDKIKSFLIKHGAEDISSKAKGTSIILTGKIEQLSAPSIEFEENDYNIVSLKNVYDDESGMIIDDLEDIIKSDNRYSDEKYVKLKFTHSSEKNKTIIMDNLSYDANIIHAKYNMDFDLYNSLYKNQFDDLGYKSTLINYKDKESILIIHNDNIALSGLDNISSDNKFDPIGIERTILLKIENKFLNKSDEYEIKIHANDSLNIIQNKIQGALIGNDVNLKAHDVNLKNKDGLYFIEINNKNLDIHKINQIMQNSNELQIDPWTFEGVPIVLNDNSLNNGDYIIKIDSKMVGKRHEYEPNHNEYVEKNRKSIISIIDKYNEIEDLIDSYSTKDNESNVMKINRSVFDENYALKNMQQSISMTLSEYGIHSNKKYFNINDLNDHQINDIFNDSIKAANDIEFERNDSFTFYKSGVITFSVEWNGDKISKIETNDNSMIDINNIKYEFKDNNIKGNFGNLTLKKGDSKVYLMFRHGIDKNLKEKLSIIEESLQNESNSINMLLNNEREDLMRENKYLEKEQEEMKMRIGKLRANMIRGITAEKSIMGISADENNKK